MSKTVRVISRSICCFSVAVCSSAFAQGLDGSIPSKAKGHLLAYADCAKHYLGQTAQKDPTATFERVEGSLRPACGYQVDRAREALFRENFSRGEANAVIRSAYASMQPELRSFFDLAASSQKKQRRVEKDGDVQTPRGEEAESVTQDQIRAVETERTKLLRETSGAFEDCLISELRSLAPSSNEPAETLTKVIEIKCRDAEKKVVSLGIAFYGASKNDFEKIIKDPLEERKKRIVADIVTLRAELAKEAAKPLREAPEASGETKPPKSN